MKKGTKVKMSEELKQSFINNDCQDHVDEFGDCIGLVEDKIDQYSNDVNVRWQPSGLRYGYDPEYLIILP
jgi:hypothetical protein